MGPSSSPPISVAFLTLQTPNAPTHTLPILQCPPVPRPCLPSSLQQELSPYWQSNQIMELVTGLVLCVLQGSKKFKQSIVVISFPILSAVACGWGGFDLVQKGLNKELGLFSRRVNSSCHMLGACALQIGSVWQGKYCSSVRLSTSPTHSWINSICSKYLANYFCTRVRKCPLFLAERIPVTWSDGTKCFRGPQQRCGSGGGV